MARKIKNAEEVHETVAVITMDPTLRDAMVAVLIVSVTINLYVLITWVTLQVTTIYDSQIAAFLFTR